MKAIGASLLLIALVSVAERVGADPIYGGTLTADQPFSIVLDNASIPSKTTVTVIYYLTTGRPATKFDVHIVPAGARLSFLQVIPRGTRLLAIELALPAVNSTSNVEVAQVGLSFPWTCVGGCTLTFDLQ